MGEEGETVEVEAEEEKDDEMVEKHEEVEAEKADDAEGKGDDEEPVQATGKPKKLTNQFNFCERAALTYNSPFRVCTLKYIY